MSAKLYERLIQEGRRKVLLLTLQQEREILGLYDDTISELSARAETAKDKSLTQRWLDDYVEKGLKPAQRKLAQDLRAKTSSGISSAGAIGSGFDLQIFSAALEKAGIDLGPHFTEMFSKVPAEVLKSILGGDLYRDGKGLSGRTWSVTDGFGRDIDYILKRGLLEKKSALALAKDLEAFLDPAATRPWNWGKVYPNLRSKQIDYNAQRLARTSIMHGYRESQYQSAERNPFVDSIHWALSSQHYERQVKHWGPDECDDYANQNWYGLGKGNFPKDKGPLSHPQCLCHTSPVISKSLDQVATELKAWARGGNNPMLEKWYWRYGREFIEKTA